ncbi:hypothetical protein [Salipiger bermudensis]|uniref:hypothetical protein n=1 Tax=Salipiger bermudensis TaxID=344736 RepID=UPI001A8DD253|nr:hypothetical protein [Salipiger bermudensis]MBN9678430.1 hypothetical protein [Salipiger bermudensis]
MSQDETAKIAEQVSLLMQLDRTRHHVGTELDMAALANVPAYIASVFEQANAIGSDLSPAQLYEQVNKRISQLQAQVYLMRVEMENRFERDPARIYEDPLAISAYGERLETITTSPKSFSFEPAILAHGWYPAEINENGAAHRWMRPGDVSLACVPHLGTVDQRLEIEGYALEPEQLEELKIRAGETVAEIETGTTSPQHFTARLTLSGAALKSANYLPVEFTMSDFRQPNSQDTRMLGVNVSRFVCRPAGPEAQGAA